jgi:hypothetical protein
MAQPQWLVRQRARRYTAVSRRSGAIYNMRGNLAELGLKSM